jgi:gluconate 2-dehydrogenase gamma chain
VPVFFTEQEYAVVVAACERVIPADEQPGATDAAVAEYIDTLLGAFSFDPPRIWAVHPRRDEFHPLTAMDELAWRTRIEGSLGISQRELNGPTIGWQQSYRDGLAGLGDDFVSVDAVEQKRRLRENREFLALLHQHACEGMYGAPAYGGNRGLVGWSNCSFEGDV